MATLKTILLQIVKSLPEQEDVDELKNRLDALEARVPSQKDIDELNLILNPPEDPQA